MNIKNKRPVFVPDASFAVLSQLSKSALMDIAWNLSAIGTNETPEAVLRRFAREAVIVAAERGDKLPEPLALLGEDILGE